MPGAAQTILLDWSGVRQDKSDRKLQPVELKRLINYRRLKDGQLDKRLGHARQVVSAFHGATYAAAAKALEPADGVLWRTEDDQLWALDDAGEGYSRGEHPRATPRWYEVENLANSGGAKQPLMIRRGDDLWTFALGVYNASNSKYGYQVTVTGIDGTTKLETTKIDLGTTAPCSYAVVVDSADNVWLLWVDGASATIGLQKFTAINATPTVATYHTESGANFIQVDAVAYQDTVIVVALSDKDSGGDRVSGVLRSYGLASGTASAASSFTPTTVSGGAGVEGTTALSILAWDMSDGFYYVAYWKLSGVTATELKLEKVAVGTPATTTGATLTTGTITDGLVTGSVSGHLADNGDRVVFATLAQLYGADNSFVSKNKLLTTAYVYNGTTTVTAWTKRSASVASKPFQIGTKWYLLTHFDDDDSFGTASLNLQVGTQNGYWLRDAATGRILSSILDADAGLAFFGVLDEINSTHFGAAKRSHHVTPVALDATSVAVPLLSGGLTRKRPGRAIATLDFGASYYSDVRGVLAGGVVASVSSKDPVTEIAPLHSPYAAASQTILYTPGASAVSFYLTWLYVRRDSDGNITPSAPYPELLDPLAFVAGGALFTIDLPTCRHALGELWIAFYASATNPDGTPLSSVCYLQDVILNDPTVDTVRLTFDPFKFSTDGERLYSTNGVPNFPPEPARIAWRQGTRTMLGATPNGDVWVSVEQVTGRGPEFPEVTNFATNQFGTGELVAGVELASDSSALFKQDGIAIVTGNPDGRGAGGWAVTVLQTKKGVGAPTEVCKHPLGVVFRNLADGRMQLLSGGAVSDISAGMEDYRDLRFSAALDCPAERMAKFYAPAGALCLDYGHPPADQPAGAWIWHEGEEFPAAVGARLIGGEPVIMPAGSSSAAEVWRQSDGVTDADFLDDGAEVLTDLTTGRISPSGFMNEFDTDWLTLSSTHLGGDSTYEYTITGPAGDEVHPDAASDEDDVTFRTAIYRAREVQLRIRETSATGQGRRFDGAQLDVCPYGQTKRPFRQIA